MSAPVLLDSVPSTHFAFEFYDEVDVRWEDERTIVAECPWLTATVALAVDVPLSSRATIIHDLPKRLVELPLVKIRPRKPEIMARDLVRNSCRSLFAANGWTATIPALPDDPEAFRPDKWAATNNDYLLSICDHSRYECKLNAVSAFTLLRRKIFQSFISSTSIPGNHPIELPLVQSWLQQSYFLTSHSVEALSVAGPNDIQAGFRTRLSSYIDDERGHHLLIEKALIETGELPRPEHVSHFTRYAVELLAWVAKTSGFALASCLSFFEMGGFLESDPIAERLKSLGFPGAAQFVELHFEINRRQRHGSIGLELADKIQLVSFAEICLAEYVVDLLSVALERAFVGQQ